MAGNRSMGGLFGDGDFAYADGDVPVWSSALGRYQAGTLRVAVVAGGAAGDLIVTGIDTGDHLLEVLQYAGAGIAVTDVADLTSEFAITADDTINNGGGTNTTGSKLVVRWIARP